MDAKGGDLDHVETSYESLAQHGTTKISPGEKAIAPQMATKGDKAQSEKEHATAGRERNSRQHPNDC
jgi:hypothetical protein